MSDSVYLDVLTAVRDELAGLLVPLPHGIAARQVRVRRRVAFFKEHDLLPLVLVCPEAERPAEYQMSNGVFVDYPVTVAVLVQNDMLLEDLGTTLALRQVIRRHLLAVTLAGAADVFDVVGYDPSPAFPPAAVDAAFDTSLQKFTYRATEPRYE